VSSTTPPTPPLHPLHHWFKLEKETKIETKTAQFFCSRTPSFDASHRQHSPHQIALFTPLES
jgi:hypothetical protein